MTGFCDLPEEIILQILSYVPKSCLNNSASQVCQKFRRISKDVSLYIYLNLDDGLTFNIILNIFYKYKYYIKFLIISNRNDMNRILEMVPLLSNLQILKVKSCTGCSFPCSYVTSDMNADLLSNILLRNVNLISLGITHSSIQPGDVKIYNKTLKEIILKNSYYQRSLDKHGILNQNCLEILNLQNLIISRSTLTKVLLNNIETLHTIKLDIWEPQSATNNKLIAAIGCCNKVKKILLRNFSFYGVNEELSRSLVALKKLTSIKFYNVEDVSSNTLVHVFSHSHFRNLQQLFLCACDGVNSIVIRTIASNCLFLSQFAFHQPKSTEYNVVKAEDILFLTSNCKKIQILDICYTHLSIGKCFVDIVSGLPQLEQFKYCPNLYCVYEEESIISIFNFLICNLKTFQVCLKSNSHLDNYILGIRNYTIIAY